MMNLYSGTTCPFSHRCRIVLFEKGMDFQVIDVDLFNKPEEMAAINPHNRVPVLVERDLVLFEPNIINEYIDERFPHPQLMPADPIMRARARQLLIGMEREIFSHMEVLEKNSKAADKARQEIRARLTEIIPIFNKQKFMLGDEFSMLDHLAQLRMSNRCRRMRSSTPNRCATPTASGAKSPASSTGSSRGRRSASGNCPMPSGSSAARPT